MAPAADGTNNATALRPFDIAAVFAKTKPKQWQRERRLAEEAGVEAELAYLRAENDRIRAEDKIARLKNRRIAWIIGKYLFEACQEDRDALGLAVRQFLKGAPLTRQEAAFLTAKGWY